jgi:hypothetical protein
MHGPEFSRFNYAKQYPSKLKQFHNWGIGSVDSALYPPGTVPQEWPGLGDPPFSQTNSQLWMMKSIQRTIQELQHDNQTLSIIKIDVEGAEWDSLISLLSSSEMNKKIQRGELLQLLGEFHWDPDSTLKNHRHKQLLDQLLQIGFIPWHIERHEGSDCCLDIR